MESRLSKMVNGHVAGSSTRAHVNIVARAWRYHAYLCAIGSHRYTKIAGCRRCWQWWCNEVTEGIGLGESAWERRPLTGAVFGLGGYWFALPQFEAAMRIERLWLAPDASIAAVIRPVSRGEGV